MVLRKCIACHEMVGAESDICPRCGVNFRNALIHRIIIRILAVLILVWLIGHFALHKF